MRTSGGAAVPQNHGPQGTVRSAISDRTIRTTHIASARVVPITAGLTGRTAATTHVERLIGAGAGRLEHILIVGDALVVFLGFTFVLQLIVTIGPSSIAELGFQIVCLTGVGVLAIRSQQLWVARVNSVRAIELSRITRAVILMGLGTIVLDRGAKIYVQVEHIVIACFVEWWLLVGWRSAYRTWLGVQRKSGRFRRQMLIVGTDRRAMGLADLFDTHPEVGIEVVGLVGSAREARDAGREGQWLANYADADAVLARSDVDAVVLCSSDIHPLLLDRLLRDEQSRDRELYLDPCLSGIDVRRVRALPIAYEPLLQVESPSLSRVQIDFKRAFDIAVSLGMLLLLSPVLVGAAVVVKLTDRGPVLFKQTRVGRNGVEFRMLKFRSMCVDAEARLAALRADNNDRTGPLFKLERDPRITRIGHVLRAFSIDELPQLVNVLRGDMSLVGPRPALPTEVAEFPADLHARHLVRPGITGLWQMEARDNPSFDAYRRLDLFYVENWSLLLDLIILLGTVDHVVLRPFLTHHEPEPTEQSAATAAA